MLTSRPYHSDSLHGRHGYNAGSTRIRAPNAQLTDIVVSKAKQAESATRLNRLMPTAAAPAWDELQGEAQYQHAKGLLQQLKLIA